MTTTMPVEARGGLGAMTMLDMLALIAACAVSVFVIRAFAPPQLTAADVLLLATFCGPAGLAVFGPWVIRRQFLMGRRDSLAAGEFLWLVLAGGWVAFTPALVMWGHAVALQWERIKTRIAPVPFAPSWADGAYIAPMTFGFLVALITSILGIITLVQSVPGRPMPGYGDGRTDRGLPWTHWAGIALTLVHAAPILLGLAGLLGGSVFVLIR
jgi:hypothetical protein